MTGLRGNRPGRELNSLTLPGCVWSRTSCPARTSLSAFAPLLRMTLASNRPVAIPAPGENGWAVEMISAGGSLLFGVTTPHGREAVAAAAAHGDGHFARASWDRIIASSRRNARRPFQRRLTQPKGPWLIESLGPALSGWSEATEWLPAFTRSVAWCWLEEGRVWQTPTRP